MSGHEEAPGGNLFDKYRSRHPIVKLLVGNFFHAMLAMLQGIGTKRMLDVGCGDGFVLNFLDERLKPERSEGIDVSQRIVRTACGASPHLSFTVGSAYALPYAHRSFDLVVASEVLEHLDRPADAVAELRRVTSRYCLVSVPHEPFWQVLNVLRFTYLDRLGNTPGHVQHFSPGSLRSLLGKQFLIRRAVKPFPWLMVLCETPVQEGSAR